MTKAQFQRFCTKFYQKLYELAPKDTWNLADHGITLEWVNDNECNIYVNEREAPYMVYTNEPWIAERWNEKKNPNEHWWNNAFYVIASELAQEFGGTFEAAESEEI